MTYNELREEVLALGFESELESEERLRFAAKRAMNIIFTERPLYKTLMLAKPNMAPILKIEQTEHRGGTEERFEFSAKSYSFISSGAGTYTVSDAAGVRSFDFGREKKQHRGFLHGEGSISFTGDFFYTVYNLAFFDELYGESESDIPLLDGFYEYDIKSYADDFLACGSAPEDEHGIPIEGASVSAGLIKIPTDFCGRVFVKYKSAPNALAGGDDKLILPDGCEHLLPLLVSAYIWLDDDTEKSEYYMMLYREAMAAVRAYNRDALDGEYTVKDGWA